MYKKLNKVVIFNHNVLHFFLGYILLLCIVLYIIYIYIYIYIHTYMRI